MEYNPEGNGWCGYYALAYTFLSPGNVDYAEQVPVLFRSYLKDMIPSMKTKLQNYFFFDFGELEETLNAKVQKDKYDWWCDMNVIYFAAILFEQSFLFCLRMPNYREEVEEEEEEQVMEDDMKPSLFSVRNEPPKYLIYFVEDHFTVYTIDALPDSFSPTPYPLQKELDEYFATQPE